MMATLQINRYWRDAIGNPERQLCRKWLARQWVLVLGTLVVYTVYHVK